MTFMIAKTILAKLKIQIQPSNIYSQLIDYNGTLLKQLNNIVQVYLLCYSYSRFQTFILRFLANMLLISPLL